MARHRSPSGAQTDDPGRTAPLRVVDVPGVHRLPAPPAASVRGRATVAAVAAGAVVAGGQTLATTFFDSTQAVAALQPVAQVTKEPPADPTAAFEGAIGGDQLLPDPLAINALDPASQVDVQNLAKAVDIGRDLARQAAKIEAALSDGAPEAYLYGETAFVKPTLGHLTSLFGSRWGRAHEGIDIAGSIGTPIYALTDAVVEESGPATGYGLCAVEERRGNGLAAGHHRASSHRGDGGASAHRGNRWRRETVHARDVGDAQGRRASRIVRLGAAGGAVARQDLPFSTDRGTASRPERGLGIPQRRRSGRHRDRPVTRTGGR